MSFTKNDQAVVLNRESLQYLANCIRLVHSLPDLLNDVLPSQTTTYSSYKVTELLNTLNTDLQNYVNNALGNLSNLKKKIVSVAPTDDSADEDTIYLVQDASGGYEQYLKINGVVTSLGSTSAINNVYTKTESDGKFALLSTLNSLITVVGGLNDLTTTDKTSIVNAINELKTELTSHTSDTDIHITTAERDKWNKVEDKVDKTSILTAINDTPSDSNLLSEKAIKSELDKKSNNTDLDNFKQGILVTSTSMNKNILLWDVGHYYFDANLIWQSYKHIPNTTYAPHVYVTSVKPIKYKDIDLNSTNTNAKSWFRQIKVEDHLGNSFIRTIYTPNVKDVVDLENGKLISSGSDTGWQRVSTSVADVPITTVSLNDKTNYKCNAVDWINYEIYNGVCFLRVLISCVSPSLDYVYLADVPKPRYDKAFNCGGWSVDNKGDSISVIIAHTGKLNFRNGTSGGLYLGTISYPVAEQQNKN